MRTSLGGRAPPHQRPCTDAPWCWQAGVVTTSGVGLAFMICFIAVVVAAVWSVAPLLGDVPSLRQLPTAGLVLWLAVAVPSAMQVALPALYDVLNRNAAAIMEDRQWWRVLTALVVQDGGVSGTLANLILLGVALVICCPLWGAGATVLTFVLAGTALNVAAVLAGAEDGAGTSGATLTLLASLPLLAFAVATGSRKRPLIGLTITAVAAIALIAVRDGHGYAVALGLLLGLAGVPLARSRSRRGLIASVPSGPT